MPKEILIIIIVIIFIICLILYKKKTNNTINVKSDLDNENYLVQNLPQKSSAATTLSIIRKRIFILRDYLEKNIDSYPTYKPYIEQFIHRINNLVLTENDPRGKYTSYTVNKGDKITLCLRSKKTEKLHDINLIMYVVLHELAHVACPEINHTKLFKKIFIFFLKIASKLKIYQIKDYQIDPTEYCGLIINENLLKFTKIY